MKDRRSETAGGTGRVLLVFLALTQAVAAPLAAQVAAPAATQEVTVVSDSVTINVVDGSLSDVLNAFSRQTGRNIVIGPTVTNRVNLRLTDTPWSEALDVILKPYGLGYKLVGKTIVVNELKELTAFEAAEPMVSRVFTLKYLDASDVLDIVQKLITTNRGSVTVLATQGQKGWEFESRTGGSRGAMAGVGAAGARQRVEGAEKQVRSKTLIVKDTPSVLDNIAQILNELDKMPAQILIEARFVEVSSDFLRDLGLQWGTGATGVESPDVQAQGYRAGSGAYAAGLRQVSGGVTPTAFSAGGDRAYSSVWPFDAGLSFKFQQLTDTQFEVLMHMLQEDSSMNVLSAPRILTLNNQEAAINVGQKFPIIKSDVTGDTSGTVSTSLDYYESIGIQLNVVPQVCGDDYISMIVHPAVTDFVKTEGGVVATASGTTQTTQYPVLSTREADTQIVLKNGSTIVIGGLLKNRDDATQIKVPILGDIPLLGHLFRRKTDSRQKLDLLIFLTASIVPSAETLDVDEAARAVEKARAASAAADRRYERTVNDAAGRDQRSGSRSVADYNRRGGQEITADRVRRAEEAGDAAQETERQRIEDDSAAREAAEQKAKAEAARREEEFRQAERARLAAERQAREEAALKAAAEERAREEAAAKAAAEEKARLKAAREAEKARLAAEEKAREEAEEKAAAEEKARLAAEKRARAEAAAKAEAERRAQIAALQQAEKARLAAEKQAQREAARKAEEARKAEKARLAAERKARGGFWAWLFGFSSAPAATGAAAQ